jgi:hypothetical protein
MGNVKCEMEIPYPSSIIHLPFNVNPSSLLHYTSSITT